MREQFPPVKINIASVNVIGWPGLALVLIVVAIAMAGVTSLAPARAAEQVTLSVCRSEFWWFSV